METSFELSLETSFLMSSSAHQSINVKFFELLQCFTFRIILSSRAILRVFVSYSHSGDSISSKKLNGHQAFESMDLLGALISPFKQHIFIIVIITSK